MLGTTDKQCVAWHLITIVWQLADEVVDMFPAVILYLSMFPKHQLPGCNVGLANSAAQQQTQ